ncbi:Tetrahydrofolate dehydrogenase/cyclohydrolase, NA [Sesbania bispinosa]|nr:Tetrahydrofolate dehydrogenase/cyclohydrolase, NA [Sesbania bispinosa]
MVRGSCIKPGAVIIDVGINVVEDPNSPQGYRLDGDICYEETTKVASAVTPVPGGVGCNDHSNASPKYTHLCKEDPQFSIIW